MKINMNKLRAELIASETKPVIPILAFPGASLVNCTVSQLVRDRRLQLEVMKAVSEKTGMPVMMSMMDLSVEADAFGAEIVWSGNEVPAVCGALVSDCGEVEALAVPSVSGSRTEEYVEAVRAAALSGSMPVLAGAIGPFSLAGRLMDINDCLMNCYDEPETVHLLLEKTTEFIFSYISAFKAAGANGVILAEPLAGIISPDMAAEFSHPYVKRLIDGLQDDGFAVIYHNCGGNVLQMAADISGLGAWAVHFGNDISMPAMLEVMPADTLVMGNLAPVQLMVNGSAQEVAEAVSGLLKSCSAHPNFILSSGCDLPPDTPWENIDAMFSAAKEYYRAK